MEFSGKHVGSENDVGSLRYWLRWKNKQAQDLNTFIPKYRAINLPEAQRQADQKTQELAEVQKEIIEIVKEIELSERNLSNE